MHDYSLFGNGDPSRLATVGPWRRSSEIDLTKVEEEAKFLVAARMHGGGDLWYYKYEVITVLIRDGDPVLYAGGDLSPWFWDWSQVDFVIELKTQSV